MSEFASAFVAHVVATSTKYPTCDSQTEQYTIKSLKKIDLDPQEPFSKELLFTSHGDSEYFEGRSAPNDCDETAPYEKHLFVVPRYGDTRHMNGYVIYFDAVVGVYRVSNTEPFNYEFGKHSSRGFCNRVWGERSAVDIDIQPTESLDSGADSDVESTDTFDSTWTKLATQAWGSSKLCSWADDTDEIEYDINAIAGSTAEQSVCLDLAASRPTEVHEYGCASGSRLAEDESGSGNQAQKCPTVCSSLKASEVTFVWPTVSEQEESTRSVRALNLDILDPSAGTSWSAGSHTLEALHLSSDEEFILKGHDECLQIPKYSLRNPHSTFSHIALDDEGEMRDVHCDQTTKLAVSEQALGIKTPIVNFTKPLSVLTEEEEEQEEDDNDGVANQNLAVGNSDFEEKEGQVPFSILRSQVPHFSKEEIWALRDWWPSPGMALTVLTWQSMSRVHRNMVDQGLYTQKRLQPNTTNILTVLGIKDRSVFELGKGVELLSYAKPDIKPPLVVDHYNYYGQAVYYPTYTPKLHSMWATTVRKFVDQTQDPRKWVLINQAELTVDTYHFSNLPIVYRRGSKGFARCTSGNSHETKSYWPRKSLLSTVQTGFHEGSAQEPDVPVLGLFPVYEYKLCYAKDIVPQEHDVVAERGDAIQILEAQEENKVAAEDQYFYDNDDNVPGAMTELENKPSGDTIEYETQKQATVNARGNDFHGSDEIPLQASHELRNIDNIIATSDESGSAVSIVNAQDSQRDDENTLARTPVESLSHGSDEVTGDLGPSEVVVDGLGDAPAEEEDAVIKQQALQNWIPVISQRRRDHKLGTIQLSTVLTLNSFTPPMSMDDRDIPGSRNISGSSDTTVVGTPTSAGPELLLIPDDNKKALLRLHALACSIEYTKARIRELEMDLEELTTPYKAEMVKVDRTRVDPTPEMDWVKILAVLDHVGEEADLSINSLGAEIKGVMLEAEPPGNIPGFHLLLSFFAVALLIYLLPF